MQIYIDTDFKCHISPGEGLREAESDFFNGKCRPFVEGYRYVPEGERWVKPNGVFFVGEMIAPWKDYNELWKAQAAYELEQYEAALAEIEAALGVIS